MNKIFQGDCLEVMKTMEDKSIDMVLTSPPYDNLRDYKGYTFNFEGIAKELFRVVKDGGVVVWVVGDAYDKNGSETLTSFKQALYFKEIGFTIHDTMIYQKNSYPFPPTNRYYQVFEYMFVLSKGKPKTTNIQTVPTIGYKHKSSTQREKDGTIKVMKYKMGLDTRKDDNIWKLNVGYGKSSLDKISFKHPATFPEKLAERHIISWSNEGDIILDPFAGSGTTCKMAKLNNRDFIGIEISEEYCKIIEARTGVKTEVSNKIEIKQEVKYEQSIEVERKPKLETGLSKCCNAKIIKGYCEMCCEKV
jgi:site-specific DNA-methyltransferase (adenine-specific)